MDLCRLHTHFLSLHNTLPPDKKSLYTWTNLRIVKDTELDNFRNNDIAIYIFHRAWVEYIWEQFANLVYHEVYSFFYFIVFLHTMKRAVLLISANNIYNASSFILLCIYWETCKNPHFRTLLSIIVPYQWGWSNFPHCRLYRSFVSLEEWKIDLGHQNVRTLMTWELLGINQTVYRNELPRRSNAYATTLLHYYTTRTQRI
jgi:hypothetical protein